METNLLTGAGGFIGSYLVRRLLEKDEKVVILKHSSNTSYIRDVLDKVTLIRGDFANFSTVADVIREYKISSIFHLGSIVPPAAEESITNTMDINFKSTVNILESARMFGVKKVLYASSIGVYGSDSAHDVDDDAPQFPSHVYGMSKMCSERIGEQYYNRYGVDFRGLRLPAIIGAGRWAEGEGDYCDRAIGETLFGKEYEINGEPETCLPSAVYVKDAVDGFITLRDADNSRLTRRMYNIHGFSVIAKDLVKAVEENIPGAVLTYSKTGHKVTAAFKTWPKFIDTNARKDWGWSPGVDNVFDYVKDCVKVGTERPYLYK